MRSGRAIALAFPFVLVALGSLVARRGVAKLGDRIGRHLSSVVTALRPLRPPSRWKSNLLPAPGARPIPELDDAGAPDASDATPLAVTISPGVAQRAIDDQGSHIHASTFLGADGRPAGIRLTGVSGLGVGLRDGDVLVTLEGEAVTTDAAATDLALSAIARGRTRLHVTALRGERPVAITVELPPVPAPRR